MSTAAAARASGFALVTGATSGIGAEFARQLAGRGHDLVLVARDTGRLDKSAAALAGEYGIRVEILVADLTDATAIAAVERRAASIVNPVEVLVNNAGFGLVRHFDENSIDEEITHLDLHVTAPMRLMHAAIGQMLARKSGTIVNIASVAAFTPRDTYGAAKAWVISFSRWANVYYRGRGVRVTAVAPGFVRTEFHERMDVTTDGFPRFLWLSAEQLVRSALRDVDRGKSVSVPTLRYKTLVALTRILPDRVTAAGSLRSRESSR